MAAQCEKRLESCLERCPPQRRAGAVCAFSALSQGYPAPATSCLARKSVASGEQCPVATVLPGCSDAVTWSTCTDGAWSPPRCGPVLWINQRGVACDADRSVAIGNPDDARVRDDHD